MSRPRSRSPSGAELRPYDQRVAKFRTVHLFPYSGWPEWPWEAGRDSVGPFDDDVLDRDAAAKSARAVTEAISLQLQSAAVVSRRASYMINILSKPGESNVEVGADITFAREGFLGRVLISRGFHRLPPTERAALLSEVVHRNLAPLADAEGWRDTLDQSVEHVRASGFECRWTSPWKSTPDRQRQVRLTMKMADDGYGRWKVEVADLAGEVLRESPELSGWTWVENYQIMAKEMHFDPDGHLIVGRGSGFIGHVTAIDLDSGSVVLAKSNHGTGAIALSYPGQLGQSVPLVVDEEIPLVSFTGGYGPVSDQVMNYHLEAARLTEQIQSGAWVEWWAGAGAREVDLAVWYTGTAPKILLRQVDDRLTARRFRPPSSVPESAEAAVDEARSDVARLISKVRARFDLPEPPPLV